MTTHALTFFRPDLLRGALAWAAMMTRYDFLRIWTSRDRNRNRGKKRRVFYKPSVAEKS